MVATTRFSIESIDDAEPLFCATHDPVIKPLYRLSAQNNPHRG